MTREAYQSPLGIRALIHHGALGVYDHVSRLAEAVAPLDEAGGTADDPRWDDLRVSLARTQAAAGAPTYGTFKGAVNAWAFAKGDALGFDVQLPHDALLGAGATLRPHVHWSMGNSTDTGTVQWGLDVEWANPVNEPDNEFATWSPALTVAQAGSGTAYRHQLAQFPNMDATLLRPSAVLLCRLIRIAAGDTGPTSVYPVSVDFHYQRVSAGSVAEYPTP